jgi:alpha-D-ribose 1-methylphosphonate 5-triphosphate synthase subunit PhnG
MGDDVRRAWLAVLAQADAAELEAAHAPFEALPLAVLRPAEIGLVMVRGRMGGTGRRFNLGEMTVTRCAVTDGAVVGHGHVRGRDRRKALLVARLDALLQRPAEHAAVQRHVIAPLAAREAARRDLAARRAAATRVELFTLKRGEP